ncbi:glycogen debranching protein GlgX [Paraliomyxa miuraensis]|uniref:glycogen debranching protein GlgX n=1 Tax=Paraliomyxa miuraensis TaxID=376150 RepID=UPI0022576349|nr:glycogen debranching protein GlgX [Paraliomyxa miuraensis]MCX4239997.1 glycogen debranching protein GlgX [Paraliomyxa miuraensis]
MKPYRTSAGRHHPLGATVSDEGVNFSLFSRSATAVELLLFDRFDRPAPQQVIRLDSRHHRTYGYWHVFVHGAAEGLIYGYRVHGPWAPEQGHRFNPAKLLLDPYARGIVRHDGRAHRDAMGAQDNVATAMKSLVVDLRRFDWQGVERPRIDPSTRVIYEMHVRGFTRHPSSGVAHPGTFDGLVERIPYLVELGITTVELLPVFQFDEHDIDFVDPTTGKALRNFWGYDPIGFFSPHRGYYIENWEHMRYLTGFRDLVRELHRAGLEVVLDVVFNHTAEGGEDGPTLSFRGIENAVYYLGEPGRPQTYANYSGVGNTLNCNHPIVRRMILDCLRYWAVDMRVDGFRFDLASILSRDESGQPMHNPPLPWEIEADPALQETLLVAEAWDAGGLYQVGGFPGERWSEWNGKFRDDVRRFLRGDEDMAGAVAARMLGSPDLYERHGRVPQQCINFVTCHDGFTLGDLVSYERKHNEANGEDGRDGSDHEHSANYGVEGPTDDPAIEALRNRQVKNFLALLLLAQGTPMVLAGDELRRTQRGNNNAYCQDNEVSWIDWGLRERHADIQRFTRLMIAFRRAHPGLRRTKYLLGYEAPASADPPGYTRVRWHGTALDRPDWSRESHTLAYTLTRSQDDQALHVIVNAWERALRFDVPRPEAGLEWHRAIDTSRASPDDIGEPDAEGRVETRVEGHEVVAQGRSVVVLVQR